MKVIFLDIDGVLNNLDSLRTGDHLYRPCINTLNTITDATGAKIVVSSAWRGSRAVWKKLRDAGVTGKIIADTPRLERWQNGIYVGVERGQEIAAWLEMSADVESFVILDDDDDMCELVNRLVHTNYETGLTETDAQRAIAMLEAAQ